jgi:anti-sigma B factor antagonist
VRLVGELDASSVDALREHLDPLPVGTDDVIIDLSGVAFIDSSGLGALIQAHQLAESVGRRVIIFRPTATVLRLLEISGLTPHLHVDVNAD